MSRMLFYLSAALFLAGCSAGVTRLTPEEEKKFDPPLRALLSGQPVREAEYDVVGNAGEEKQYAVIVRADDLNEVKNAGYSVMSGFGEIGVVRVTLEQMRRLAKMPGVRSITNGSQNQLH